MKNLSILPSIDDPKNTNFLKFEWHLFSICLSDNVCESAIYIVPFPPKTSYSSGTWRRVSTKGLPRSSYLYYFKSTTTKKRMSFCGMLILIKI